VIAGFATAGWTGLSPEAELARASYEAVRGREVSALLSCASGRELVDRGYRSDVEIAAEVNLGSGVPLLDGLWFTAAR
jgi:2-phosphosulfolactate phosphatase